ncbi:MAG: FixH family protein [Steroidobacteraceae bacterium]
MNEPSRAWREPMMWLVMGLPAITVVAGITMVILYGGPGTADTVSDEVQRTGQIQQTDLSPDMRARELGLSAHLRLTQDAVELRPVSGTLPREALQLTLAHPLQAAHDVTLQLQPADGMWRASAHVDTTHDWNLQLAPASGAWRLTARLPRDQVSALLAPLLQTP